MPQPISKEQQENARNFYGGLLTSFNSSAKYAAELGGDFLSLYTAIKEKCNSELEKLKPTDQAGAALEFDGMLSSLAATMTQVQFMMGMLMENLSKVRNENAEASTRVQAQLAAQVPLEIEKLITSGELIRKATLDEQIKNGDLRSKEMVTQMCAESRTQGELAGEQKVRNELAEQQAVVKRIGERKALVQTAALPMPAAEMEAILGGDDAAFTAARTTAEARNKILTEKRVSLNSGFRPYVWAGEEQWKLTLAAVDEVANARGSNVDPFATGGSKGVKPKCSI